jgi:hypothetical protein
MQQFEHRVCYIRDKHYNIGKPVTDEQKLSVALW